MVYLILGTVVVLAVLVSSVVVFVRHREARRKVTIFHNGRQLHHADDFSIADDGVPVFNFHLRPNDVTLLVRGDGTREVVDPASARVSRTAPPLIPPAPMRRLIDGTQLAEQLHQAFRSIAEPRPRPPEPARPASRPDAAPARFDRDLDIPE